MIGTDDRLEILALNGHELVEGELLILLLEVSMAGVVPGKEEGHAHQCFPLYRFSKLMIKVNICFCNLKL